MRYFKRWAAWLMSAVLLGTSAPTAVSAASGKDQVTEMKKLLSGRQEAGYEEGEALVMYRTTASGQKGRSAPFSSGIKVKQAWNFSADTKKKTRSASQNSAVSIARVTSQKSTEDLVDS